MSSASYVGMNKAPLCFVWPWATMLFLKYTKWLSCHLFLNWLVYLDVIGIQNDRILSHQRTRVCYTATHFPIWLCRFIIVDYQNSITCNVLAEWFLAMLIQLMSATKLLKGISRRSSNFASGASIGMLDIDFCAKNSYGKYIVVKSNFFPFELQDFGGCFDSFWESWRCFYFMVRFYE